MRILLLNPNTSSEMTDRAAAEARRYASAGSEIVGVTGEFGCTVIASRASFAIAAHAALDAYARRGSDVDSVILACFGDPGLAALREIASVAVVGLAECAVNEAAARAAPFAIVTAGAAWVPMLADLVHLTPHGPLFRGVFALDATGLSLGRAPERFVRDVDVAVERAAAAGARTIILGGAAFAGLGSRFASPVPLLDPLQAAVRAAEEAVRHPPPRIVRESAPALACRGLSPELAQRLAREPPATPGQR